MEGVSTPRIVVIISPSPLLRERKDRLFNRSWEKGPDGSLRGDIYKKSHACCPLRMQRKKKKEREALRKKRKNLSKQTSGSHGYCQRSRDVKRSREQHKGRDKTAESPFPSRPFCSLRRGGIAPLRTLQVVAPGRRARGLDVPLRPQGSFQLVKMPACPSCGKGSLSVAVDRNLNPGTLELTVGGKSSRA